MSNSNRMELGKVYTEVTGYKPGDRILPFISRCWLSPSFSGLRFAYGLDASDAEQNLLDLIKKEPPSFLAKTDEKCLECDGSGVIFYGAGDRRIECKCHKLAGVEC